MSDIYNTVITLWKGLPPVLRALMILIAGLFAAKIIRILFKVFLKIVRFGKLCNRIGFTEFLRKGGTHYTPVELLSNLVFWAFTLFVFMEVSKLLDLTVITDVYSSFSKIIPGLIAAVLIMITGWVVIEFCANFTVTVIRNAGVFHADLLGKIIRYLGLLLIVIIAIGQVEIGTGVLGMMLLVFFSAACFGLALAFGLGCKDIAREIVQRMIENLREQSRQGKSGDLEG